jgi:hypothetical protein
MTKPHSAVDMATEMLRDLEKFERSGGKEAFLKQLREEFVRRSGAASLDEALATAMTLGTSGPSRKRVAGGENSRREFAGS